MLGGIMKKAIYILLILSILSFGVLKLGQYAQAKAIGMQVYSGYFN